jgi:sugar transferase (PEP-CTERM system associated)
MRVFKHYIPLNLLSLVVAEIGILLGSVYTAHKFTYVEFNSSFSEINSIYYQSIILIFSTVITFYIANIYDLSLFIRKKYFIIKIIPCYFIITFVVSAINYIIPIFQLNRMAYIICFSIAFPSIIGFRLFYYWIINANRLREKVLILGASDIAWRISEELESGNNPGFEVLGYVAEEITASLEAAPAGRILGGIRDLQRITRETSPDVVVVALSERRGAFPAREILDCKLQGVRVEDWPSFYEKLTGKILIQNLRPSWLIFAEGFTRNRLTRAVKRTVDTLLAIFGLWVSLPMMVCIAILTKLDSPGPVIFTQERVGENGKIYTLSKFRTMVADAEKHSGPVWSQTIDPRVTKLGNILRRTGMDEIPQLFNVLKGDMSFVGPRPERPHFVAELQKHIPYYAQRLVVKPGITGWAQVRYGYGATIDDAIEKLQYDLYYIKNMSVFLDLLIMLSTVHKVLFAKVAIQTDLEGTPEVSTSQADSEQQDRTAGTELRVTAVNTNGVHI